MSYRKIGIFFVIALTVFLVSRSGNARRASAGMEKPTASHNAR
jgi:hypothetical protein